MDVASGQVSTGMFNSIARGAQMKLVADKGYIDPKGCDNLALVARKGLVDPKNVRPEPLRGKKLNVIRGTWNDYYVEKLLSTIGLKPADFELVNIPSASQPEAMNKGTIDLTVQNEPFVTRLTEDGHSSILTPITQLLPNAETAVTVYGAKLLGANADVGKRFMVAYLKAVRKYNEGKSDSNVKTMSKYTKLDEALLKKMCWPTLRGDGVLDVKSVLEFQSWAATQKLVDQQLSEQQIYDPSFIQYANQKLGTPLK